MDSNEGLRVFEDIPDGTLTLEALLEDDDNGASSLILVEVLDAIEELADLCQFLAADRDPLNRSRLLWDPTNILKPEEILMFPKSAVVRGSVGFRPKCFASKVEPADNIDESDCARLLEDLFSYCFFDPQLSHESRDPSVSANLFQDARNFVKRGVEEFGMNSELATTEVSIQISRFHPESQRTQWQSLAAFRKEATRILELLRLKGNGNLRGADASSGLRSTTPHDELGPRDCTEATRNGSEDKGLGSDALDTTRI